jgi:hypothetical protein
MDKIDYEKPSLRDINTVSEGECTDGNTPPAPPKCQAGSNAAAGCDNGNFAGSSCKAGDHPENECLTGTAPPVVKP